MTTITGTGAFLTFAFLQGKPNLSPYSYFNVMSHDPPYVCIGGCAASGRPSKMKDTQQNLQETK